MKTKRFVLIAVMIGMAMSVSAQEATESKYGADSVACVTNLSTYREYYKQWESAKFGLLSRVLQAMGVRQVRPRIH